MLFTVVGFILVGCAFISPCASYVSRAFAKCLWKIKVKLRVIKCCRMYNYAIYGYSIHIQVAEGFACSVGH